MKKLMFTAAAALCATVGFAIESSNVVGYSELETVTADIAWKTIAFQNLGAEGATYKLKQLHVADVDFAYWNNDYIATIAPNGAQDQYYTFDPDANDGKGGWFACDEAQIIDYDAPADEVELEMNQAIFVLSASGVRPTVAGAVLAGDSELYAVAGDLTFTGNFTPAPITLGDLVIDGDFAYWNNDYIATIAPNGAQEQYYTYDPDANEGEGGWFACDEAQIIDYDAPADAKVFAPSEAFIFLTANGASLSIPSPL